MGFVTLHVRYQNILCLWLHHANTTASFKNALKTHLFEVKY